MSAAATAETARRVRPGACGIFTRANEELVVEPRDPRPGSVVCVASGTRLAFRRVLAITDAGMRLRADVAPFEDRWDGPIVGCVRPRGLDRLVAIDAELFTRASWRAAITFAHAAAARRRVAPSRPRATSFTTRELTVDEWPRVRAFWRASCGDELPVEAQTNQKAIGLFDGEALVGANIHLVLGATSYSAYTLVDRRYRGLGGGLAMIERATSLAVRMGLESVYVHVNARNLPSLRAYRRAGFVKKGWWADASDPLASAERQWLVLETDLTRRR